MYNPRETRFIKEAKEKGAITICGDKMILNNVLLQFELFTGQKLNKNNIKKELSKLI